MFVFDNRRYFNPEVVEGEEPPFNFVRLTPEEEQEIPWANATTMGEFVGQKLSVTDVSDRYPRLRFVWLELVYDKELSLWDIILVWVQDRLSMCLSPSRPDIS
jgi:hypothetical protein